MTDRAALIKRLRHLAEHRALALKCVPEVMEEWKAADIIEDLAAKLEADKMEISILAGRYTTLKEAMRK